MKNPLRFLSKIPPAFRYFAVYPLAMFYFESLFRISTVGGYWNGSLSYLLLFSIVYGLAGILLTTIGKKPRTNTIVTTALLSLTAVIYLVEYFVFRYFKIFYDLNTVAGGAGDVAGGFMGEVLALIFSLNGLSMIFLFLLPAILYPTVLRKFAPAKALSWKRRGLTAAALVAVYLASLGLIQLSDVYRPVYKTEYNFQNAVGNFGLITGVRLDLRYMIFGNSSDSFTHIQVPEIIIPTTTEPTTEPTADTDISSEPTETTEAPPPEYGKNIMYLSFPKDAGSKITELNRYVQSLTPSKKNAFTGLFEGKNLIFITAEAFSAEVIDPELTPTLYRLANKGIQFTDYYQPAGSGTTGGEYQNVFGMLPTAGGASFKRTADDNNYFTMGSQLNRLGYYGVAYHNNDYTYYDRHRTHNNIGYSEGFIGWGNGMEEFVVPTWPESDLEMFMGTVPTYIDKQPFNIYYMTVSGHSNYNPNWNAMSKKNWDVVKDLPYSKPVRSYIAANLELEYSLAYLMEQLEAKGIADDTVICISTDHFPYGLDDDGALGQMPYLSELYGYNVRDYLSRDHSRLILWCGILEDMEPIIVDTPTSSLDILPTLSNLFGTEFDSRLMPGRDVFSDAPALVFTLNYDWKTEYGTYLAARGTFEPKDENIEIPEGYVESIKAIIKNKIYYCTCVLETDYYSYLFPDAE